MFRLAGTVVRNGSRYYVSYDTHNDRYVVHLKPGLDAMWSPAKWAQALATGEASLIGPQVAA